MKENRKVAGDIVAGRKNIEYKHFNTIFNYLF